MKLRWTPTTIIGLIAVIVFIAVSLLATKCSAQTYKADSISITVQYNEAVDEWMTQKHGTKQWPQIIRQEWREAWKNRKSEAKEAYKLRMTDLFDFDGPGGLSKADQQTLLDLKAKQDAWKQEKLVADSTAAAAKEIGSLHR